MNVASIDYWANSGTSRLHRASALGKGLAAAVFVLAVILATSPYLLLSIYLLLVARVFVTRLPARQVLTIAAYPTIFALLFAASRWNGDLAVPAVIILKALTAAQAMVLLITTTPYPDLFAALGRFMQRLLADGLFVTYRSFFLLLSEMGRMLTALRLRGGIQQGRTVSNVRNLSKALGMLLVHAMDLSERMYAVLKVRGYRGRIVAGDRWRAVSRLDLLPLAAGCIALSLALLSVLAPGVWLSINGAVVVAAFAVAVVSFALSLRRGDSPEERGNGGANGRLQGRPAAGPLGARSPGRRKSGCV